MYNQLKLDNQLCFRLYTASRLLTQAYNPLLKPLGLTYPQYLVMMVLWEKDNQIVSDLCSRLMLDTNTVTPILQRMERQGLVVRSRGVVDGRQTLVSLSRAGRALEEKAKDVPSCLTANLMQTKVGNGQLATTVETLDKLIAALGH